MAALPNGGIVNILAGRYTLNSQVTLRPNVWLKGASRQSVTAVVTNNLAGNQPVIVNQSFSSPNGELGCPGIRISGVTFDGGARTFPNWLSRADGTPVTDPEADYRVGGCLAPTTIATATAVIVDGEITEVNPVTTGSGYVYPPTVWITGDGRDAIARAVLGTGAETGQVVGYTIIAGRRGSGYTTATIEVAGGGADPAVALYAADRRNSQWRNTTPMIRLQKCDRPLIEECGFLYYSGININDFGSDGLVVDRCYFEGGGQTDFASNCLRSASFGSIVSPPPDGRRASNTVFSRNYIKDWNRGTVMFDGDRQRYVDNTIEGWSEGCVRLSPGARDWQVARNVARRGRITDIVGQFMEAHGARGKVLDNTIEDSDGNMIRCLASHVLIRGNTFLAGSTMTEKVPFGPFSERVGFAIGKSAAAGENRNIRAVLNLIDAVDPETDEAGVTYGVNIENNEFIDPNGTYLHGVTFGRGAAASIRGVNVSRNNLTEFSGELIDHLQYSRAYNPDAPLRTVDNHGHASSGAVLIHRTLAAATSGRQDFVFGFRPRVVQVMARAAINQVVAVTNATFVDEESRLLGTAGSGNLSGANLEIRVESDGRLSTLTERGGPRVSNVSGVVFGATSLGFNSRGWSFQVSTSTEEVQLAVVGIP